MHRSEDQLAQLGVNELGRVLVAEWHIIGQPDGDPETVTYPSSLNDAANVGNSIPVRIYD